jgi:hypothetical protein
MKPILCVVDLTESSQAVLKVAVTVASACDAHLLILFSYRLVDLGRGADMSTIKSTMDAKAKDKFNELEKTFLRNKNMTYEFHPEIGFVADRVSAYIKRNEVGLIILVEDQVNDINETKSFTFRQFIADMKLPFIIVPAEVNAEAILS